MGRAGIRTQVKVSAKLRDNPQSSWRGKRLFKRRKIPPVFVGPAYRTELSDLTACLFSRGLGSLAVCPLPVPRRMQLRALNPNNPRSTMCQGPPSWLLTIHPDLAVPILVSRGQQCLGFFSRQVPGICREALQDGSERKSQGGSQVKGTLQEHCADGGPASAKGSGQQGQQHTAGWAVASPSWVGVREGQAVLSRGLTSPRL